MTEEETSRKSKINKEQITKILKSIGAPNLPNSFLPKKTEVIPKKVLPKHDLSLGKCVDPKKALSVVEEYNKAYRLPSVTTAVLRSQRQKGTYKSLHTYRSRMDTFKLERLYVPQDLKVPGKCITEDIDPAFFSIIEENSVKDRVNLKEQSWALKTTFLTEMDRGIVQDETLKIEEERERKRMAIEKAVKDFEQQAAAFEKFLQEDHAESAKLLVEAEQAEAERMEVQKKLDVLEKELHVVKSKVVKLEEEWRRGKILQKFLYNIAPVGWKRMHAVMHGKEAAKEGALLERIQDRSTGKRDSLSSKLARVALEKKGNEPLALYFDRPEQLQEMFENLEDRNRSALELFNRFKPSKKTMDKIKDKTIKEFADEEAGLRRDVLDLKELVEQQKKKRMELQEEAEKVSDQHLHRLITEKKAVSITAWVEDTFEKVIGPNDIDLDALAMMKAIEETFHKLHLELDIMPSDVVGMVQKKMEKEEKRVMDEANVAATKVHQMERLVTRLTNALKPWSSRTYKPKRRLNKRSQPPREKLVKPPPPPTLTKEELEQRQFFTNTENDDKYRPMA